MWQNFSAHALYAVQMTKIRCAAHAQEKGQLYTDVYCSMDGEQFFAIKGSAPRWKIN